MRETQRGTAQTKDVVAQTSQVVAQTKEVVAQTREVVAQTREVADRTQRLASRHFEEDCRKICDALGSAITVLKTDHDWSSSGLVKDAITRLRDEWDARTRTPKPRPLDD